MAVNLLSEMQAAKWQLDQTRYRQQRVGNSSRDLRQDLYSDMIRLPRQFDEPWPWDGFGQGIGPSFADKPKPVPAKPTTALLEHIEIPELGSGGRVDLALEVEDLLGYSALRKDAKAPSKLERILQALEIDIYKPEKVLEYKGKMKEHFQAKADNADRLRIQKTGFSKTQTVVSWKMVRLDKYTKPVPEHVLRKCVQIKKAAPEAEFYVDELVEETRTLDPFMVVSLGADKAVFEVWDEPEFEE